MYVPALIFGHLLTSSNYDDEEKKVTGECRQSDITQLLLWMQKSYWKQRCWLFDWFQVEGMAMVLNSAISLAPSSQWKQHVKSTDTVSNRWDNYKLAYCYFLTAVLFMLYYYTYILLMYIRFLGFHSNPVACFIILSFLILLDEKLQKLVLQISDLFIFLTRQLFWRSKEFDNLATYRLWHHICIC